MRCPFCAHDEDRVIDSRPSEEGSAIRRRRECTACNGRFTTYEKIETLPLLVIKKDGSREPFNRDKLITGILKSCEKRPVSPSQIESLVNSIEAANLNSLRREVTSHEIGEMVMDGLKKIDEVAYVRFASVYRQFKDVNSFLDELNQMLRQA
jgi:transcriptional repressor NrdR